ncbi:MAG: hypothetical protein JWN89_704 [Parcubacteria group bacterium]|nr:hypothetical protein [Parcubacteria group bacterium]
MDKFPPKKILLGITKSNFGGAQRYVLDLASELKKNGHEVKVLAGGSGPLISELSAAGVEVISLPSLGRDISLIQDIGSFIFIWKTLMRENPDVFHINSSKIGGLGALAARMLRIRKVVFTSHGWAFNEERPLYQKLIIKLLAWFTILLSHTTIAVSEKTKQDAGFPFIQKKLVVIRNGIGDIALLPRDTAREKLLPGIAPGTLLFGAITELHPTKGIDILLKAWAQFKKDHEGELVIIGGGEEKENLEKVSKELGVEHTSHLKGFMLDARTLLSGFDVFLLPSRSEGMPYALLEAGRAGLPIIASRVGGIPEVVTDEVSGLLVPPKGVSQLASALAHLAENRDKRRTLGETLKKHVETDFSLDKMTRDTLHVYE